MFDKYIGSIINYYSEQLHDMISAGQELPGTIFEDFAAAVTLDFEASEFIDGFSKIPNSEIFTRDFSFILEKVFQKLNFLEVESENIDMAVEIIKSQFHNHFAGAIGNLYVESSAILALASNVYISDDYRFFCRKF